MSKDFYRTISYVEIRRCDTGLKIERDRGVRVYCQQHGSSWALQVRAPQTLSNGREGKDYMIATASLSREDMVAVRDAVNAALMEE